MVIITMADNLVRMAIPTFDWLNWLNWFYWLVGFIGLVGWLVRWLRLR